MVRRLHMNESDNNKKKRINEDTKTPTIDEMREALADFGFDPAGNYDWENETLFDYFMTDGFYATANLETMQGYFSWCSPSGDGYNVEGDAFVFDLSKVGVFTDFLATVHKYDDYDDADLIDSLCIKSLGFDEVENWVYVYEFDGSNGHYVATVYNKYPYGYRIEGDDLGEPYQSEYNDFIEFMEEVEYLEK